MERPTVRSLSGVLSSPYWLLVLILQLEALDLFKKTTEIMSWNRTLCIQHFFKLSETDMRGQGCPDVPPTPAGDILLLFIILFCLWKNSTLMSPQTGSGWELELKHLPVGVSRVGGVDFDHQLVEHELQVWGKNSRASPSGSLTVWNLSWTGSRSESVESGLISKFWN